MIHMEGGPMSNDTEMAKVVINAQYGGFSLSDEAAREYLRRTGRTWSESRSYSMTLFDVDGEPKWYDRDIPRTDPVLIALVEEMGAEASGPYANLVVEKIPKGTLYMIDEYDGYESIQTRDGTEWAVA